METTDAAPKFAFNFFRFVGEKGNRHTELVRNHNDADGLRGLVDQNNTVLAIAKQRVNEWASAKGISVSMCKPFPSPKYPGKVWLEFRFGTLLL